MFRLLEAIFRVHIKVLLDYILLHYLITRSKQNTDGLPKYYKYMALVFNSSRVKIFYRISTTSYDSSKANKSASK